MTPLTNLLLDVRSLNCLMRADIDTVEKLTSKTQRELLRIPNLGNGSLLVIQEALAEQGLHLRARITTPELYDNEPETIGAMLSEWFAANYTPLYIAPVDAERFVEAWNGYLLSGIESDDSRKRISDWLDAS